MRFTYDAYRELLKLIENSVYHYTEHNDYGRNEYEIFLRHDVDISLEKALQMAELEAELNVRSTYFILLRTDFYNPASSGSMDKIRGIVNLGHQIGLHFDEVFYGREETDMADAVKREADLLSGICEVPITMVSMHRPSRQTLEADLKIPGMINTYGKRFFQEIKYVSDSRRNWKEPVEELIKNGEYPKLQILVHPFWYYEEETSAHDALYRFVRNAGRERYEALSQNIRDVEELIRKNELWS